MTSTTTFGSHSPFSRRRLLAGSATLALGAAGLSSCGSGGSDVSGGSMEKAGTFKQPTYVPYPGIEPDIPAEEGGIPAAYFRYPDPPKKVGNIPLPEIKPVSMLVQGKALDVPPEKNSHFKMLETDIGTKINMTFGGFTEYKDKFQVTMASGDLPDLVMMITVPQLPKLLETNFTDLSDHLGGDKIKDYPGLASIPTDGWMVPQLNGRLWGVPQMRPAVGRILSTRGDLLKKRGIDPAPKLESGEDFKALLKELTDPKKKIFAMGADPQAWLLVGLLEMMGAPNGWRDDGGSLINVNESEEMEEALSETAKIWKAGYVHPNSFSDGGSNFDWLEAGTSSLYFQAFSGWGQYGQDYPDWEMGSIALPKWDGGGPAVKHLGPAGYGAYIAISQQKDEGRLEEILRVLDYVASPFGTEEYLHVNYGVAGEHYEMKGGNPVPTKRAQSERVRPIQYAGSQLNSLLYVPGQEDTVKAQHAYLSEVMPGGVQDATYGLYSEASVTKGATAGIKVKDAQREIIQGRRPLSEWANVVKEWKQAAGDAMRGDYEKALANS